LATKPKSLGDKAERQPAIILLVEWLGTVKNLPDFSVYHSLQPAWDALPPL
jgi:hypothetical protein